jgi:hypothetical protein
MAFFLCQAKQFLTQRNKTKSTESRQEKLNAIAYQRLSLRLGAFALKIADIKTSMELEGAGSCATTLSISVPAS